MTKYIFVTGGVSSSLGKGIIAASLAKILQARGLRVTIQKFDPYINIDPGTLNPYEHGEVYVTEDGAETDLDLGHYERFLNTPTSKLNDVTTGMVYQTVIDRERRGEYNGKTVQVIPHITDEIKRRFLRKESADEYDVILTELGGTVGDIESLPYIEAVRQVQWELGSENCLVVHLTLIPYLQAAKELKTKPTQHSVRTLSEEGVRPDIIVCRTSYPMYAGLKEKIALFCNVAKEAVIEANDAPTIYEVPLNMMQEKLDQIVMKKMKLPMDREPQMEAWKDFLSKLKYPKFKITIGLVGKYVELQDAYKSILESFIHAGAANECKVEVRNIQSEHIHEDNVEKKLTGLDGILVAPGFGNRGVTGKIEAIRFARTNNIPFLGIALGMQCAMVEFARNVLHWERANSTEIDADTPFPVIHSLLKDEDSINGTPMRLGAYACEVKPGTLLHRIYEKEEVSERHRHRYEFNNEYLEDFEKAGMIASGWNKENDLQEVFEIKEHPFFVACQFNPEMKSTVLNPHPIFIHFIKAAIAYANNQKD